MIPLTRRLAKLKVPPFVPIRVRTLLLSSTPFGTDMAVYRPTLSSVTVTVSVLLLFAPYVLKQQLVRLAPIVTVVVTLLPTLIAV